MYSVTRSKLLSVSMISYNWIKLGWIIFFNICISRWIRSRSFACNFILSMIFTATLSPVGMWSPKCTLPYVPLPIVFPDFNYIITQNIIADLFSSVWDFYRGYFNCWELLRMFFIFFWGEICIHVYLYNYIKILLQSNKSNKSLDSMCNFFIWIVERIRANAKLYIL